MKKPGAFNFQLTREGIENHLGEMERKLDRLRSLYESFFMGMERMPPNTPRHEMNRMMLEMQQVPIGNAALRFRFQALTQKWVLLVTYWNRTMREIEAGTYHRDMARTQRHLAERGGVITEEEALALGIPKSRVKAFIAHHQRQSARKPGTATPPAPAAANAPKSGPPPLAARGGTQGAGPPPVPARAGGTKPTLPSLPGLSDQDFEGAYQRYLDAHRKLGIQEQAMPREKMHSRLGKQLPKILDEKNCDRVRLEIAVEDGKVRLRAWPAEH